MVFPGEREAGLLTTFAPVLMTGRGIEGGSTMDAATTAECRREGGGSPDRWRSAPAWMNPRALWSRMRAAMLTSRDRAARR